MNTQIDPIYGPYDPEQTNKVTSEAINMLVMIRDKQTKRDIAESQLKAMQDRMEAIITHRIDQLSLMCRSTGRRFNIYEDARWNLPYTSVSGCIILLDWEVNEDGLIMTTRADTCVDGYNHVEYNSDMPFSLKETLEEAQIRITKIYQREASRRDLNKVKDDQEKLKELEEQVYEQKVRMGLIEREEEPYDEFEDYDY